MNSQKTKLLQIGITGGIGTGKSTVCKLFASLGIPIYDADSQARLLMDTNAQLKQQIVTTFGAESYENGQLNRRYLAQTVFGNSEKVTQLNALVHPCVAAHYATWVASQQTAYIVKEAALLFESSSWKHLDKIIVVTAPLDVRLERIKKRDPQRTETEIQQIMAKQMPEEEKISRADYLINNDGLMPLMPQVEALHQLFNSLATSSIDEMP